MRSRHGTRGIAGLLLCLSLVAGPRPAMTQEPPGRRVIGQVGGPTRGVVVEGQYAYLAAGMRLVVLDVSDPAALREAGASQPFPHFAEDVAVRGALAYVAAGAAGLRVLDVSDPTRPTEIGSSSLRGYAEGVAVAGSIAYLADGPYGLRIIDASAPSHPVEIGSAYTMNYAFRVAVQGRYAFIAAAGAGLLVAEVSDSTHPVEVASLPTTGYSYGVAVKGDTAFVADGWEGVKLVDVSDPAHPRLVAAYRTPGWAFGITVVGDRAYVADAFGGLRVLDVADPHRPVEVAYHDMPGGHAAGVSVSGDVAFVADRFRGLRAVSLSGASNLSELGSYRPLSYANAVAVAGNYAYVAAARFGLAVVDLSDPTRPKQAGDLDLGSPVTAVAVSGQWVYAATATAGLCIVDVSDPANPTKVAGHLRSPGGYRDMVVSDETAFLANEWGLEIVRVSDPLHPEWLGFLQMQDSGSDVPDTVVGVAVSGPAAFLASSGAGLEVVDVSDPRNPIWKGAYAPEGFNAEDVAVDGDRAYVVGGGALSIVDVSDSAHPVGLGSLTMEGQPSGVTVAGDVAYVADGDRGLAIVDVSDPHRPLLTGTVDTPGFSHANASADGRVYLADGIGGLLILERAGLQGQGTVTPCAADRQTDAPSTLASPVRILPPAATLAPSRRRLSHASPRGPAIAAARCPSRTVSVGSCVVTSAADSGDGTLRACLTYAETGATITFDPAVFPPSNPATIRLTSELPGLDRGNVTIDASTAGVILDGSAVPGRTPGLLFITSDGNAVRGLQIVGFPVAGIAVYGSYNVIGGDRTRRQGNVVGGNRGNGIVIDTCCGEHPEPRTGSNNLVVGNFVGTDASGTRALGNLADAVFVVGGATANRIGGLEPGEGNVVSGNAGNGITIGGPTTSSNSIVGNYVGTDVTGTFALPNLGSGISIEVGAFDNLVQGNLSSGNRRTGVSISDWGSSYNVVVGNRIGTDASGTRAVPNQLGVFVGFMNASFNRIGGLRVEDRNIVSGNRQGMVVQGPAAAGNLVVGNLIGPDVTGECALGNWDEGLGLQFGSRSFVGGATLHEANVIGATRAGGGVRVMSDFNYVAGNLIGTDLSGRVALGDTSHAVCVTGRHNTFAGNVIAHSAMNGIVLGPSSLTTIRRNSIHANAWKGIEWGDTPEAPAPPVIATVTATAATGTACPGCDVEIFSDAEDEGRVFEGSIVADGSGAFTFTKAHGYLTGPNVTATATDEEGSTSEFSAPQPVPPRPVRRRLSRR